MVFNPAIPQPTDFISISQGDLLGNMGQLQTWSNVDHYPVADNTINLGKHAKSTYPFQAAGPATLAGEVAVYSKKVGGITELFCRKESSGVEIQLTNGNIIAVLNAYVNFNGTTGAINGTAANVSSVTVNATGNYTINLSVTQPTSTYCVLVSVEAVIATNVITFIYGTRTVNSFNVNVYAAGTPFNATSISATIIGK